MDVSVTLEAMYRGTVDIDEDEYLEWLEGAEDTDRAMQDFLEATEDGGRGVCERIHMAGMGISGPSTYYEIDTATTDGT